MPKSKEKKTETKTKTKSKASDKPKVKAKAPTKAPTKKPAKKTAKQAAPGSMPVPVITVTHDDIAKRAYELWLGQGCPEGRAQEHWAEAEKQLVSV